MEELPSRCSKLDGLAPSLMIAVLVKQALVVNPCRWIKTRESYVPIYKRVAQMLLRTIVVSLIADRLFMHFSSPSYRSSPCCSINCILPNHPTSIHFPELTSLENEIE